MPATSTPPAVSSGDALKTAESDAAAFYGDLSRFRIEIGLEDDGWHIEYRIRQPKGSRFMTGGGPWYVIDATTGAILDKKYYQ